MTDIPDWVTAVPAAAGVHPEGLAQTGGAWTRPFTVQQLVEIGLELMEQFLKRVVNAVVGVFIPGLDAFTQLKNWALDIGSAIQDLVDGLQNLITGLLTAPANFLGNIFDVFVDGVNTLGQMIGGLFTGFGGIPGGGSGDGGAALVADLLEKAGLVTDTAISASEDAEDALEAADEALANWADWLGEGEWANVVASVQDFLNTKQDASDAKEDASEAKGDASEALGNWTDFLSEGSWGDIAAAVSDFLSTKSTAGTASSNASTALGNWTTFLSSGSWANVGAAVSDFLDTKNDASQALSDADDAKNDATQALGNWTNFLSEGSWGSIGDAVTDFLSTKDDAGAAKSNASQALGNWTSFLSGGSWANVGAAVSDFLDTKNDASQALSDASDAKDDATQALGNWTSFLSEGSWGDIGEAVSDFLSTKSTASTASSNATTALGNWTNFLSGGSWANIGDAVSDFLSTKSTASDAAEDASQALIDASEAKNDASEALGNWTDFLSEGSWGDIAAAVSDFLSTKSTAGTASSNASTALGNWTNFLSGGSWANAGAAASDINSTKSTASTAASNASTALGNWTALLSEGSWANAAAAAAEILGAKSTAESAQSEVSDTQEGIVDNVLPGAGTGASGVGQAMLALAQTVLGLSQDVQDLQQQQSSENFSGRSFIINFADYPNGESESVGVPFDLDYTGSGSGRSVIANGVSTWNRVVDGDVQVIGRYDNTVDETETDFQWLQATAVSPMGVGAEEAFCARMNADKDSYVYIKGYRPSLFEFKCELGCYVNGVKTVFVTDVDATFSLNLGLKAGIGNNPYHFQVYSGPNVIIDYVDENEVSEVGEDFRGWGFFASTANNGQAIPAAASRVQCSDNAPAAVAGTAGRFYRAATTGVSFGFGFGGGTGMFPNNSLDTVEYISSDLTWTPGSNCRVTVSKPGMYVVTVGAATNNTPTAQALLYVNGDLKRQGSSFGNGSLFANTWSVRLNEGDYINPGLRSQTGTSLVGNTDGSISYFEIVKVS